MKRVLIGITMCFCIVINVLCQHIDKKPTKRFSVYRDTLVLNREFKTFQHNTLKDTKYHSRDLDLNYLAPSYPTESNFQQLQKALALPKAMLLIGLYSGHQDNTRNWMGKHTIQESIQYELPGYRSYADDYIQWAPIAMTYGIKAYGIKGANDMWTSTKLLLKAELITSLVCHTFKRTAANARPNGRNTKSFPSGHTSQAFVAATFMHKELGHLSPWYSVAAYGMASTVGTMRMMNNMHWFSDVMVGAALGTGITNMVYFFHNKRMNKKKRSWVAAPSIQTEHISLTMHMAF